MRKLFPRKRPGVNPKSKRSRRFKAACLSLGLATAWSGEAAADVTFKLTIAPRQTLSNAVVFYGNNRTSGALRSLGTISGGQTSTIFQTLSPGPRGSTTATEPDDYDPALGSATPYFVVMGLYQEVGSRATVSFPDDDAIEIGQSWEELFESPAIQPQYHVTELEFVDDLINGHPDPLIPGNYVANAAKRLAEWYGGIPGVAGGRLSTPYGQTTTLVNFSTASSGGTVIVEVIPEPATWWMLVTAAGVTCFSPRRRGVK